MTNRCVKSATLFCIAVSVLVVSGCSDPSPEHDNDYLIRVGDRVLTVQEFRIAFEIAKSAYPHNEMQNPFAFKAAQMRLLNQLTEELILMERARELDIAVSEQEIDAAISKIKQDYPDDVFEQTLLEYAVSYDTWKQRLKTRLLMEKVVKKELKDHISISATDILSYYEAHYRKTPHTAQEEDDINRVIVDQLRREKAEDAYHAWIQELQGRYAVQINTMQWERMIGS